MTEEAITKEKDRINDEYDKKQEELANKQADRGGVTPFCFNRVFCLLAFFSNSRQFDSRQSRYVRRHRP